MTRRRAAIGVALGVVATIALAIGWTRWRGPDDDRRLDLADRGAEHPPSGIGRPPRPSERADAVPRSVPGPRHRPGSLARPADPTARGTASATDAATGGATATRPAPAVSSKPGTVRGHADLPRELAADREDLEIYVVQRLEIADGTMTTSWSLPHIVGADGAYEVTGLVPGSYTLQVALRGRGVSEARRLELARGASAEGVDFRFQRTANVHGTVCADADFKPIANAKVSIVGEPAEPTDASGGFDLFDLPPGTYEVFVTHPDYAPAWPTVEIPIDGPPKPLAVYLVPGGEARILATDPSGAPVAGLAIDVASEDHLATSITDMMGVAWVRGLTPGERYVATVAGPKDGERGIRLKADPTFRSTVKLTTSP